MAGKVFTKLAALASVASIVFDANDMATVTLADGFEVDGQAVLVTKTAHAARLWIESAVGASGPVVRKRGVHLVSSNENATPETPRYPGLPERYAVPIWELPKGWNRSEEEGRDAYATGFARDSHAYGDSLAGREFATGWDLARRNSEVRLAA